jgi:hypothetical protein
LVDITIKEGCTVLEWLDNSAFSQWVVGESLLGWPLALTVHALGTAIVIGFIFIIDLRLLGFFQTIPYASLSRLFPVVWFAVVFQALSGFTLWMTKPSRYVADGAFVAKFSFVIIGLVVIGFFQNTIKREAASWEAAGTVSSRGLKFVGASFLLWAAVLVAGRLTAYLGALYAV